AEAQAPRARQSTSGRGRSTRGSTAGKCIIVSMVHVSLAHSPDSDDAFMFYGLARGKVPTDGLEIVHHLKDIETLNQEARRGVHEVTAISFHAYPYVADRYALMPCGGSIGDGYGPVGVAREGVRPGLLRGGGLE